MLSQKKCQACEGFSSALDRDTAQRFLSETIEWQLSQDAKSISRSFNFPGFNKVMAFVNAVAWIANKEGHHPDIQLGYNYCNITYTTHALKGLSENDFICAAKIDQLLS
jgi:4a-hydroxytetrahydrobiopterin dehydratase